MIVNIPLGAFGGPLRNGDIVAVGNVVEHLRRVDNPNIQFHLLPGSVSESEYCRLFHRFMLDNTNYFSEVPGEMEITWRNINLWDYRGIAGDIVRIPNNRSKEKKIVVFPLFNAPYNTYRNWPRNVFEKILQQYDNPVYSGHKKIICTETTIGHIDGWEESTDFLTNLGHIMSCEIFIGGDTGTSHFVSALDNAPAEIIYFYSGHGLLHTTPFYSTLGKGRIIHYWQNFEQASWS